MKEIIETILLVISVFLVFTSIFNTINDILQYIVYIKKDIDFNTKFLLPVILFTIGLSYIIWYCN